MDRDYKHVLQDMSNIYLGGKNTYRELMDSDEISFRLKTIISRYILREVDENTTLENHFFYLQRDSESFRVYRQCKVKLSLNIFYEDGHGKSPGYRIDEFGLEEFLGRKDIFENKDTVFLTEIRIKKLNLMSIM